MKLTCARHTLETPLLLPLFAEPDSPTNTGHKFTYNTRCTYERLITSCKFPDVTSNQYNQTTSPIRFLPDGGNSTVGFTARTTQRGGTPARHTPTNRAARVRVGWSPPLYDTRLVRSRGARAGWEQGWSYR